MPAAKNASARTRIFAVCGSDDAKVKEVALRLVSQHTDPGGGDFGNDIIDAAAENAEAAGRISRDVCGALQTLPFFGGKVVWMKSANFLADTVTGRSEAAVSGFERIVEVLEAGLPDGITFVLSASSIDKRRSAYKRLSKLTNIEVFDKPDTSKAGWEGPVLAQANLKARQMGLTFETGALELLVQLAGDDSRQMETELEKIDLYLGERRRVSVQTVRQMVCMSRAAVIWDLGNAIGARDLPRALAHLDVLLFQGQNAVGILLASVVPKVRNMLLAKDLMAKHRLNTSRYDSFTVSLDALPPSATVHIPQKKDGSGVNAYPLFLSLGDAARYTLEELHAGLKACLMANTKLVTTQLDERMVLERLLVGLLGGRAPGRAVRR
jgi:DNA polymerase III subunit delta